MFDFDDATFMQQRLDEHHRTRQRERDGSETGVAVAHNDPGGQCRVVYKIAPRAVWEGAVGDGLYRGSPDDHRDGFIHLSSGGQVAGTLARHYAGQTDLVLIAYEAASLADTLKWEPSRAGELFPHVYGPLDPAEALWVRPIAVGADGRHTVGGLE